MKIEKNNELSSTRRKRGETTKNESNNLRMREEAKEGRGDKAIERRTEANEVNSENEKDIYPREKETRK